MNFIEKYVNGKCKESDIDDYIDEWHTNNDKRSLHEFLGMTWNEYSNWISDHNYLKNIIENYKNGSVA